MSYQDTRRDAAYPNDTKDGSGAALCVPVKDGNELVAVRIIEDDSPRDLALQSRFGGDYMTGVPSIMLEISGPKALTWAEAYNLGRALIDKANEAHYS